MRVRMIGVIAFAFLAASLGEAFGGAYDAWEYRMKIRMAGYDKTETLTNFPMLVTLSQALPGFDYSDFKSASGADLRFSDSSGTTELNYEIEKWDTNGSSIVWVQVPSLSSSNDFIYAYWGKVADAPACTTDGSTWAEGFKGVWHLSETSGAQADSTANRNGAVMSGTVLQGVAGFIAGGDDCTGGFAATTNNLGITGNSPRTISLWFKQDAEVRKAIAGFGTHGNMQMFDVLLLGGVMAHFYAGNTPGMPYTVGAWQHAAITYNGTAIRIFINGQLKYADNWSLNTGDAPLYLGAGKYDGSLNGKIDEVQVSTVARSSDWLWAAWCSQASNATFVAFSDVELMATGLAVVTDSPTGIGSDQATMNGTLAHTGDAENPDVYLCWDTADRGVAATSDWSHVVYLGAAWGKGDSFGTQVTGLVSGSNYTYRFYVSNSTGFDWSDDAESFSTVYGPAVSNPGAAHIARTSALMRGMVSDTGGQTPSTWFYYWQEGSETTNSATMGLQSGSFSMALTGLTPGMLYHYSVLASNGAASAWAEPRSFSTRAESDHGWYVSSGGDNTYATNWATALSSVQEALSQASAGDTVYLKGEQFALNEQLSWSNASVSVIGGYEGVGTPGSRDPAAWPTVLARSGTAPHRVLHVSGANDSILKGVSITNGFLVGSGTSIGDYRNSGAGLYIAGSTGFTLADCVVTENRISMNVGNGNWVYGGGIFSPDASRVIVTNCLIASNWVNTVSWSSYAYAAGGGLCALGGTWTIVDSRFTGNRAQADYNVGQALGGGLSMNGAADIRNCLFTGNDVYGTRNENGDGVYVAGGTAYLKNCLIAGNSLAANQYNSGFYQAGGRSFLENCTVVSNRDYGVICNGGTLGITNSILWGNGDDLYESVAGAVQAGYSIIEDGDGQGVNGCSAADPRFVDGTYFHEASPFGQYEGGYFTGGSWGTGTQVSPAVDGGATDSAYAGEPEPNGARINMGAYGNTATAAKSHPIDVINLPVSALGSTFATLNGALLNPGSSNVTVRFYYGRTDGLNVPGNWEADVLVGILNASGAVSKAVSGLVSGSPYFYTCFVSNSAGATAWASPSVTFTPALSAPVVENRGVVNPAGPVATLQGEVTSTGGEAPAVYVCWGLAAGGSTTSSWDYVAELGTKDGAFSVDVDVAPGSNYFYACYAVNSAGGAWAAPSMPFGARRIRYVAADAAGLGTGYNWSDAFPTLQAALNDCNDSETNMIYVKGGTYSLLGALSWAHSGVTLSGGYEGVGTPGNADAVQWPVVMTNGGGVARLITISGVTNGRLENVTLTGGNVGGNGGALSVNNVQNLVVANCAFIGNQAAGNGGAVSVTGSSGIAFEGCTLRNNTVVNNAADVEGGALFLAASSGSMTGCTIERNIAQSIWWQWSSIPGGAGMTIEGGAWTLQDSRVCYNTAIGGFRAEAGGIRLYGGGTHLIRNCLIAQNASLTGDGVSPYGAGGIAVPGYNLVSLTVENCTLLGNTLVGLDSFWSPVTVRNSILWQNGDDVLKSGGGAVVVLENCDIEDGDSLGVNGCLSAHPRFERGVYLAANSPCLDAGTNTAEAAGLAGYTTLADGTLDSGTVDLGYHAPAGMPASKADLYVRNGGDNGNSGTGWEQAFQTLTKALSVATEGSRVHVEAGTYGVGTQEMFPLLLNRIGIQLLGTNAAATVIDAAGSNKRVVDMSDSSFGRIEGVTVAHGGVAAPDMDYASGNGIRLVRASEATLSSCIVSNNRCGFNGAGILVELCNDFSITNCEVVGNVIDIATRDREQYGAGLYLFNSYGTVVDSMVQKNEGATRYHGTSHCRMIGAGLALGGGAVTLERTVIRENICKDSGSDWLVKRGGGINVLSGTHTFRNCVIVTNDARGNMAGAPSPGLGDGMNVDGGSVILESVTFADNMGQGVYRAAGSVTASNSIFWGNGADILGTVSLSYCDIGDGTGAGVNDCFSLDPLFVEGGYYHLQSRAGNYTGGFFTGGEWGASPSNSPCIDAGVPGWSFVREPDFNGKRINMGAYANTSVASRTRPRSGTVIMVY